MIIACDPPRGTLLRQFATTEQTAASQQETLFSGKAAVSKPRLAIRPLADGEEAKVIALWQACGLTRPWNDPAQDLAFARGKAHCEVLVGLVDGRIIACAMVGHDGHRGSMYYVGVDPTCQGCGHGRAMVAAAEAWLKARGVWKVNLLVRRGNEGALGFYAKIGYAAGGSLPIEKRIDGKG
jgi:ribosomal protein S18 acetylase RimI-like enzyme